MRPRTVHHTLWLREQIARANGDICIVCSDQDEADLVRVLLHITPVLGTGYEQNFRIVTPRSATGIGLFDEVLLDESFNCDPDSDVQWLMRDVLPRLKPGIRHKFWKSRA